MVCFAPAVSRQQLMGNDQLFQRGIQSLFPPEFLARSALRCVQPIDEAAVVQSANKARID